MTKRGRDWRKSRGRARPRPAAEEQAVESDEAEEVAAPPASSIAAELRRRELEADAGDFDGPEVSPLSVKDGWYRGRIVQLSRGLECGTLRSANGKQLAFDLAHVRLHGVSQSLAELDDGMAVLYDVSWTARGLRVSALRPDDDSTRAKSEAGSQLPDDDSAETEMSDLTGVDPSERE